ncbi:MAG: type IV-A pilus assembly ATPase PilB [bacterium]
MVTALEKKLGDLLVKDRVITQRDLDAAIIRQKETGSSLGKVIVDMGLASEWEMASALGKQLNVPFITLSHYEIDRQVLDSIPAELVRKYQIVPVDKTGDTLTVAMADPSNIYLLDELKILTKCNIVPVISFEMDIQDAINTYYSGGDGETFDEALKEITEQDLEIIQEEIKEIRDEDENDLSVQADDAPVIQLVNLIVSEAIKARASDIHVEPYAKILRLRYRVDGVLQEMTPPPKKFQNAILSRIKILSEMDIAERRLPQDGRFKVKAQNRSIDFRVSSCPTIHGEKIVIRILDQSALMVNLTDLGFDPGVLKLFESQIRRPYGMILVTGPTGSGKSTTLYSALSTINDPRKNIMTIEDPVEYQLKGINQVQAKPEIGLTFASGLRAFLRQDPDIIMVGEIRDLETAEIGVKAALTGHLVLSTLHTNDASSTFSRLTNMGVEPYLVTAAFNLAVAQRLVRCICENCKDTFDPPKDLVATLGSTTLPPDMKFFRGHGCDRCHATGYKGRVALYEVLMVTDPIRDLVISGCSGVQLKQLAIREGMESLRGAGIKKMNIGKTTIEEVLSTTVADDK